MIEVGQSRHRQRCCTSPRAESGAGAIVVADAKLIQIVAVHGCFTAHREMSEAREPGELRVGAVPDCNLPHVVKLCSEEVRAGR